MKALVYYGIIVILILWILIFGSVYETQYYDFIYMYGDELLVILGLTCGTFYILNLDFTIGLLLFLAIFFITNDLPIIHKSLERGQEQGGEQGQEQNQEQFRNPVSQGAVDFIRDASDMLSLENNMEGLLGSLNVQLNKAKLVSKF
jgi:predicted membrane protein